MTRFHIPIKKNGELKMCKNCIGTGYAPSLLANHKEGGSIGISANQPVGIKTSPIALSSSSSEGGRIRHEYSKAISSRGGDLLNNINFERKDKNSHKRNNIKFVF